MPAASWNRKAHKSVFGPSANAAERRFLVSARRSSLHHLWVRRTTRKMGRKVSTRPPRFVVRIARRAPDTRR